MNQVDLGAAGIAANIERAAEYELIFWTLIQKEHRAQEVFL